MAIDEKASSQTDDPADAAVIDNELPAYRAISPGAIVTLVLGIASVFCFTDFWFLLVVGRRASWSACSRSGRSAGCPTS